MRQELAVKVITSGLGFRVGMALTFGLIWTNAVLGDGPMFPGAQYAAGDGTFVVERRPGITARRSASPETNSWEFGPVRFVLVDLGSLGKSRIVAEAINEHGQVAGWSGLVEQSGLRHGFLWSLSNGMEDVGTYDSDPASLAFGINSLGHVVGGSFPAPYNLGRAFLWTAPGGMRDLGTLGGDGAEADDINDSGTVVGTSRLPGSEDLYPFLWTEKTGMRILGPPDGAPGQARAINHAGDVVGYQRVQDGAKLATLWSNSAGTICLGTLPGKDRSFASDINEDGMVVGRSGSSFVGISAFKWTWESGMEELVSLLGGDAGAAGLNNHGHIVGVSDERAVLWDANGIVVDLNGLIAPDSGWILAAASGINDAHQICGTGVFEDEVRAFMLRPDTDGDGVPDDEDSCPGSVRSATILVGDCDTSVANAILDDGCTMNDVLTACSVSAHSHGEFISCVVRHANEWRRQGLLSGKDVGRIVHCAGTSNEGRSSKRIKDVRSRGTR